MEVKQRSQYDSSTNPIEFVLMNRGVKKKDIAKFLFPDETLEPDYSKLDNLDEGIELLKRHLKSGSRVMINVD